MRLPFAIILIPVVVALAIGLWFVQDRRRPNFSDADEAWQTRMSLAMIQGTLGRFNQLADESDWLAVRKAKTLDELWAVFHKKTDVVRPLVPLPPEEDYLKDGWNQPYVLEIKIVEKATVIRIGSQGPGKEYFVESIHDGKQGRTRRSWGGLDD